MYNLPFQPVLMYSLVASSTFTLLGNHHHLPSLYLHLPQLKMENLCLSHTNSPFLPPLSPWQPPFYLRLYEFDYSRYFTGASYK